MKSACSPRPTALPALLLTAALIGSGCASLRGSSEPGTTARVPCPLLPRIDPTGERFFVWPKDQTVRVAAPTNPTAPAVTTDPFFPASAAPPPTTAAVYTAAGIVAHDKLSITPDRILAPVGSEVVLKAGICTTDGYLLSDQKVEWQLARNGVGQFVELGGKGWIHPPLLPWNQGSKVDNYYAVGYTASGPLCITRGNADPSDDIEIRRGEGWVSVRSPVEGTSHVTARAPKVESWEHRAAEATIYWVDVQWTFPAATVSSAGRPVTLTTTLTRQSDRTPIEGWIVRYATGEAEQFGGSSGNQALEIRSGPDGRASAEISPTDSGAPTTRINAQLIRPAGVGSDDAPRLIIANGSTLIQWTGDTTPYLAPDRQVAPVPGSSPPPTGQPSLPPSWQPPGAGAGLPFPDRNPVPPASRPVLEVEVRGAPEVQVGSVARFEVIVRNVGDASATGLVMKDAFEAGLSHLADPNRNLEIEKPLAGPLAPGETRQEFLSFDVLRAGRLCHDVMVTSNETQPVSRRVCIEAVQPPPERQASLKVDLDGPAQAVAQTTALFALTVKNTGETPLTDVVIEAEFPANLLEPQPREQGFAVENGLLVWRLPRLEAGQTRRFDIDVRCLQPVLQTPAYASASATADTGGRSVQVTTTDEHILEITPAVGGPGGGPAAPLPDATGGPLRIRIDSRANPVQAGASTVLQIAVENLANQPDEQVELRVRFPPELAPNLNQAQGPPTVRVEMLDGIVRFTPVAALRPREVVNFLVPVTANQAGVVEVLAEVRSRTVPPNVVRQSFELEIRRN